MTEEEAAVVSSLRRFYQAIEEMISGQGLANMSALWLHSDWVTIKHPMSDWAEGWEEVWTTWQVAAQFGRHDRGGSQLLGTKVRVRGDIAYAASVFCSAPAWGGERLMCTNVLERHEGAWKVTHHHADTGPAMAIALERMLSEG